MGLIFNGVHSDTLNLLINSVERGLLPAQSANLVKVAGKKGAYDFGSEADVRKFVITATLTASSIAALEDSLEEVAAWLYTSGENKELSFDSNGIVTYFGKLEGDTTITQLGMSAVLQFSFICSDPEGYGEEKTFTKAASATETFSIVNEGTAEASPIFTLDFKKDASSIAIVGSEKSILVGTPQDVSKTVLPRTQLILKDRMDDPSIWTAGSSVDGGVITGGFSTNGSSFNAAGDYGTGSAWHGVAGVRSLPEQLQDFRVRMLIGFKASHVDQMGRVEMYLLDVNGSAIAKISIQDSWKGVRQQLVEARAGALSGGTRFMHTIGNHSGHFNLMNDGVLELKREGVRWTAYAAIRNGETGAEMAALYSSWYDTESKYTGKVAAVQAHLGAYGTYAPVDHMYAGELYAYKLNNLTSTQTDQAFSNGDQLVIDCARGAVHKNGSLFIEELNPSSDFLSLKKGTNVLGVYPSDVADLSITFKNKYL